MGLFQLCRIYSDIFWHKKMSMEWRKKMITLHEAIRKIQDELIKSEQERKMRGIPPLFKTERLTIELSCVFSETDSTDMKGEINALSVLALDSASTNSVSTEKVQKITLEFKTEQSETPQNYEQTKSVKAHNSHSIPPHNDKSSVMYPHDNN